MFTLLLPDPPHIFLGLMSGTSLDGVDAVAVAFDSTQKIHILGHAFAPFDKDLQSALLQLHSPHPNELADAQHIAIALNTPYQAVIDRVLENSQLKPSSVIAMGVHGQTIRHHPENGYSLQLIAPSHLAESSQIAVICDFRNRDIAAGGQGAPLVPAFHAQYFGLNAQRSVLNLGGIANISIAQPDGTVVGCDTGPANMLLDAWFSLHFPEEGGYDKNGAWAASGTLHPSLLANFIASEPWFTLQAPKSTGRDLFSLAWLRSRLDTYGTIAPQDVQRTLLELTAATVVQQLYQLAPDTKELIVCGGGAYNAFLLHRIATQCEQWFTQPVQVAASSTYAIAPEQVEALAFAWLAKQFMYQKTSNLPSVTGAKGGRILGAYYPA